MLTSAQKNKTLQTLAHLIKKHHTQIIEKNQHDISSYSGSDDSMLDRLKLDEKKLEAIQSAIKKVIDMEDPEGKILHAHQHENGMRIENKAVPFGTLFIIYESRPDVTIEAAMTAFKAGNKILLKGGKEAKHTNLFLTQLWHWALQQNQLPQNYVRYLNIDREETQKWIRGEKEKIDLIIPRGGDVLIDFVQKNAKVPTLISGRGNNFLFVDETSDFEMAISIILNGKQRLSVCNALDKVLLHKHLPHLPFQLHQLIQVLRQNSIEVYGDDAVCQLEPTVRPATPHMLEEEFLSAKILLNIVSDVDQGIALINRYSGGHSASVVTSNPSVAEKFLNQVDCAAVYQNASTRFTDGGQLGMGAEMAISTQKIHFRGPVGLEQLLTNKWFVYGKGQIRE